MTETNVTRSDGYQVANRTTESSKGETETNTIGESNVSLVFSRRRVLQTAGLGITVGGMGLVSETASGSSGEVLDCFSFSAPSGIDAVDTVEIGYRIGRDHYFCVENILPVRYGENIYTTFDGERGFMDFRVLPGDEPSGGFERGTVFKVLNYERCNSIFESPPEFLLGCTIVTDEDRPVTSSVNVNPDPVAIGNPTTLTAIVDDSTTGNSTIASAEFSLDGGATWQAMGAVDGTFDETTEEVEATLGPFGTAQTLTVSVRGTDTAGNTSTQVSTSFNVVDPEPPIVTNVVATPNPVEINKETTLTATVDDSTAGNSDIARAEYSLDGGATWQAMAPADGSFDEPTEEVEATLGPFATAQTLTVYVRGTDSAGNTSTEVSTTFDVVDPEPPIVSGVTASPNPVATGTDVVLEATIDDSTAGGSTIVSAEYSLDGGATWQAMAAADGSFDESTEEVTGSLGQFASAQVLTVCVRGTDAAGNTGAMECIELAVYDPDGGFVTGAGWIDSPQGADQRNPDATGKARFGFISKYKKGANVPSGKTQFKFKAGDLDFTSTEYEWLVVSGKQAQFKGSGTINDAGDYGFLLTAYDGDLNGGSEDDEFRIKLVDKTTDELVYDNGLDTPLGGGNIIIHTK